MSYAHYERLSPLETTLLALEDPNVHAHVGAVASFDARPLVDSDGRIDIDRIRAALSAGLARNPRLRQRLTHQPVFGRHAWVDDQRFNLNYHLRHTSLPRPGGVRALKRLVGRIMSQQLDRGKPLWEMWVVGGVERDRIAVITKAHRGVIEAASGADPMLSLLQSHPYANPEEARPWLPRPVPSRGRRMAGELGRRAALSGRMFRAGQESLSEPHRTLHSAREVLEGLGGAIWARWNRAAHTPLNPAIGPHRRFDWVRLDLGAIAEVRKNLGGAVEDVALATLAGAIGAFLRGRGIHVPGLAFRALVPKPGPAGRTTFPLLALPIEERDPRARLRMLIEERERSAASPQARGLELLEQISAWTLTNPFADYVRQATASGIFNTVVVNVPSIERPLYLLGAPMLELYPVTPLLAHQALATALCQYDDGLYWGINADWDAVPDLHVVVERVEAEFERLRKAALPAVLQSPPQPPPPGR